MNEEFNIKQDGSMSDKYFVSIADKYQCNFKDCCKKYKKKDKKKCKSCPKR